MANVAQGKSPQFLAWEAMPQLPITGGDGVDSVLWNRRKGVKVVSEGFALWKK